MSWSVKCSSRSNRTFIIHKLAVISVKRNCSMDRVPLHGLHMLHLSRFKRNSASAAKAGALPLKTSIARNARLVN